MNTTTSRHSTAAHADDLATEAYLTARRLGASPAAAMRAHASAYAAAMVRG